MSGHREEISAGALPRPPQGIAPEGYERRTTLQALKTWNAAGADDDIPELTDLTGGSAMAVEQELFTENQFLIMVNADTTESVIIFYGSDLPNMLGPDNVGNSLQRTLPAALKDIFQDACMEAVNNGNAVYRNGMVDTPSGNDVLYRSIFMPLRAVSHPARVYVFGAFSNESGGERLVAA